jgi:hypothetical protein
MLFVEIKCKAWAFISLLLRMSPNNRSSQRKAFCANTPSISICKVRASWRHTQRERGRLRQNRDRIISLWHRMHVRVAGGGAGSIDFWVPHPRGCGWCVRVALFATHTHTHPFPSGASPILCNAQQKLPFLLPRCRPSPIVLRVFSRFLRSPPGCVIVAKVIILILERGGGGVTGALREPSL